ncbi:MULTISPECIES: MFS transporter [unclassified Caulobacter]|uniref:MFS transporter n=1 Tax=unclassified Caulobacter TaxID=2648921 RepID=UPI0019103F2C|nr:MULTISPECIES: MFS transporter [unclassified Caulobacter]
MSTVLNYLDRQALSILATTIQKDLGIDNIGYAFIVQMFLISYTISYVVAGRLTDILGTRISLALFVGWWSVSNMLTGLTHNIAQLGAARFLLGLGEAGNYTAAPRIVAERFEPEKRGLAIGIYTAGAMVGATIAPPLIAWLALSHGWRATFVITGALGLVWLIVWLFVVPPRPAGERDDRKKTDWKRLLTAPHLWWLLIARLLTDPVWYFYLFWFPKYLMEDRHLTLLDVARLAWVIYLAADFGSILGGMASGAAGRRFNSPVKGRLSIMAAAAMFAPLGAIIAAGPHLPLIFAIAALVSFCHQAWLVNLSALITDLFPTQAVGTAFGLIGAGSGLGGMASTYIVGALVTWHSYGAVFLCMAILHPVALFFVAQCRRVEPQPQIAG